ncbi:hypothetical protein PFLUV_G00278000 [Perca fluviatilis]|uniref:Uncharacterized protein n=2 Tax=Perca fluviatilis TaxID=8168 RepID=A0A6A5ECF8_PERFL|nr:hypothetical protein PFLUV_G00278000 [Perca fluviatilis]
MNCCALWELHLCQTAAKSVSGGHIPFVQSGIKRYEFDLHFSDFKQQLDVSEDTKESHAVLLAFTPPYYCELFASDPHALQIMLFQDAFEVANPLGSARLKHKVLAVYYTLVQKADKCILLSISEYLGCVRCANEDLVGTPSVAPTVAPQKFQIPWQKFPDTLMDALKEKKRPPPKHRRHMIRIIMEDMMATDTRPGRSKLKQVAQQLVERYPDSFLDKCGINVVGQGFASLVMQMENRVENVRRQYAFSTSHEGRPKKKCRSSDRYGCTQWQPESLNDFNSQEDKKKMLQDAFKENLLPQSDIQRLMSETYCAQRITLNSEENVIKVMEEWPYLFITTHLLDHTEKLMGFPVQTKLLDQIQEKGKIITEFLGSQGITGVTTDPLKLLQGLVKYLAEEQKVLLINEEDALAELPSTPCIIVMDEGRYKISVDEVTVNIVGCPLVAVSYMFSLYYVLNIKYPKGQRPDSGVHPEVKF